MILQTTSYLFLLEDLAVLILLQAAENCFLSGDNSNLSFHFRTFRLNGHGLVELQSYPILTAFTYVH